MEDERVMETTDVRMLRRIKGVTQSKGKIESSDKIMRDLGVENIRLKPRQANYGIDVCMLIMNEGNTVEPLLYDHPQNHIGVVV